jgi:hypothetical protein
MVALHNPVRTCLGGLRTTTGPAELLGLVVCGHRTPSVLLLQLPDERLLQCTPIRSHDGGMNAWQKMIADLKASGMTMAGIAREIGLSPQALNDIRSGRTKKPRGMPAVELYELHRRSIRKAA